ncbi:ABC-type Zn uptake system ZnuABC Zn-binding protein ZnuA [Leucobacter exalbidus]|uniref:ABC-type Zn uptake system ZnuABC Zn-binding protein ZnuA n=1 Tax=Leucobacter exalbidus TaxID=662960 RepID=A0A940PTD1_9MICO|nr:metal ABC transporter substrate-binding protein [Leucobacter exalbidus]MBP1326458.1 ABC-type Zn uptake system ZnuABC Zn-binding protein ZnuA [Leucobacter exalbidus]
MTHNASATGSKITRSLALVAGLSGLLVLSACAAPGSGAAASQPGDQLRVVTTTTQLEDFVSEVGGDDIEMHGLMQPGASAHHFDPSPSDLLALAEADVLVVNGLGLEPFIDSAIESSGFKGEIVTASDGIDLEAAETVSAEMAGGAESAAEHAEHSGEAEAGAETEGEHAGETAEEHAGETAEGHAEHAAEAEDEHAGETAEEHAEHAAEAEDEHAGETAEEHAAHTDEAEAGTATESHEGHDHGAINPHIWTSPRQAQSMVDEVARGLAEADPDHATAYEARATAYNERLAALDEWTTAQFAQVPAKERVLVTGHDSLSYYLHDYDITFAGAILPSFEDNAEPSAKDIDALVAEVQSLGVKAIFVESSMSPKLARTIARESGTTVVDADALYADALGAADSGAETYIDATAHNARVILEAWGFTVDPLPAAAASSGSPEAADLSESAEVTG